ncbi:hypothetical protein F2Q70_00036172 [Brassica cretica]|uniref:SWIM-type domain-containing protein n=1 Tax=Brassica cretica TaxID=69181 RepID=A0A8S9JYG9_BRACR|nr:hypothetical protein F2Q70_00036172 [Brassica cretica]
MDRQLHAVYGEWLLKDGCWNFVVDKFKGARLFFLSEGSTHAELVAMAQEDYNLDMNTESVQLAYSLPEAMMQRMAPDTPPIHVTSDRQVRNLLEIAKTHEVRLCVSSLSKMRAVSEEGEEADEWDEADEGNKADEGDEDDDDMAEDENHDGKEDDGDEDDGWIVSYMQCSTHAELVAMAQEDYNLDMNTESVQLAYSLPEAMMQRMAPDTPPIHVTSDRQVQNLLEIAKTHEVRLCVSSLSKMRVVSEEGEEAYEWDEADEWNKADEGDEDDDDMAEDENHDGDEDDGDEDDDIPVVAEAVDDAEDYSEYEEEDDDMCFEDFKGTYGSEGGRLYGSWIYVNQSFASKDALVSELRLTAVRRGKKDCVVDLEHRKCDYGVNGVEKIPCSHAIAAGSYAGLHISTLVCPVYSKDTLFAGYSENIYPCARQQVEARRCFPPEVKRGLGRQKKSRWQSWLELSRMRGRTPQKQHIVYRCLVYKETGHTRPHCKN